MPSADFCLAVRPSCGVLSPYRTRGRSLGVSSTAFIAHPPDLQFWPLMDMDFANPCPLVRPALPRIRFLFVGSRLCSTLPSDGPSRSRPCASLVLHLHQVAQGTRTPKPSDMSDTHGLRPPKAARETRAIDSVQTSEVHASMRSTAWRVAARGGAVPIAKVWRRLRVAKFCNSYPVPVMTVMTI